MTKDREAQMKLYEAYRDILAIKDEAAANNDPFLLLASDLPCPEMDVAIHEAGHAVACAHLGVAFEYVTIAPDFWDNDGYVDGHIHMRSIPPLGLAGENYLIKALAGPAATKKQYFDFWSYLTSDHYTVIKEIAALELYPDVGMAYFDHLETRADDLVEKFWHQIEAVAIALVERGTLTEEAVYDVINNVRTPLWHWEQRLFYRDLVVPMVRPQCHEDCCDCEVHHPIDLNV